MNLYSPIFLGLILITPSSFICRSSNSEFYSTASSACGSAGSISCSSSLSFMSIYFCPSWSSHFPSPGLQFFKDYVSPFYFLSPMHQVLILHPGDKNCFFRDPKQLHDLDNNASPCPPKCVNSSRFTPSMKYAASSSSFTRSVFPSTPFKSWDFFTFLTSSTGISSHLWLLFMMLSVSTSLFFNSIAIETPLWSGDPMGEW